MDPPAGSDTSPMPKHLLNWKTVRSKNIRGADIDSPLPGVLDMLYRGTLLSRILSMEKRSPISFERAVQLATEEWLLAYRSDHRDQMNWVHKHFIEWISSKGYHIELTGDEFEPFLISSRIS